MSNTKKPLVSIAIYTRKSNDENLNIEVTSIDNQKGCCRSYIEIQKEKGWVECPEAFDDPAESGKSLNRPSMQRLLKRIEEGKIGGVIVYKLDRLTRNSRDFHQLLELFERKNVAFISATESIDTKSPQGRLMTAIMVQFAQYDRELDQERSKDTHLARARKGLWCAGLPPLGYDLKEKHLVISSEEAEMVRKVFGFYIRMKSTHRVSEELNRLGYRRKVYHTKAGKLFGGKPYDPDTVTRILRRKIYIGIVTNVRTGQEFPGQHQPIVSPRVFEKVQKIIDAHRKREESMLYSANKHGFRLKGIIRCGVCNSAIVGFVQPKKGKEYRYYRCIGKVNGIPTPCPIKCIGADKIEEFVIEKLASLGSDRSLLEKVVQKVEKQSKSQIRPMSHERRNMEERIKAINREIQNLLNLVKAGGESQQAVEEIKRLENSKREMEAKSIEIEAQIAQRKRAVYDVDAIQGALHRFARFIYRIPIQLQIYALRILIKRVTITRDKIGVELHELPVGALRLALDERCWKEPKGLPMKMVESLDSRLRGNDDTEAHDLVGVSATSPLTSRTAVRKLGVKWRSRRDLNPRSLP